MATVFDMAVRNLLREGLDVAREQPAFRAATYDTFVRILWTEKPERSVYGLPPDVFARALKEAHQQMLKLAGGFETPIAGC